MKISSITDLVVDRITCLFTGVRPHERRTVCFPITVPFRLCIASSALLLVHRKRWSIDGLEGDSEQKIFLKKKLIIELQEKQQFQKKKM